MNEAVRAPQIRVIDEAGKQLGVMTPAEALRLAEERGLDLVEVSPNADPPVCRLMDYGKFIYERMRSLGEKKTIIAAAVALVAGLLIGWLVIGWWLWPVEFYDTDPVDLRAEHKRAYITMVADSYHVTHDLDAARQRLATFPPEELSSLLAEVQTDYVRQGRGSDAQRISTLARDLGISPTPLPTPAEEAAEAGGGVGGTILAIFGIIVAVILVLVGAALGWSYLQKRRGVRVGRPRAGAPAATTPPTAAGLSTAEPAPRAPTIVPKPPTALESFGTFTTTYQLGDDSYDESFAVETPAGEFLGECGVGISETIGDGSPSLVTAFEVWLFDKSDIRTVTKVLMSEYAFETPELRARLAPKGEAVLAEPGKVFTLETDSLRLRAEIVEMAYGAGEGPEQSHFARLKVELTPMPKKPSEEDAA